MEDQQCAEPLQPLKAIQTNKKLTDDVFPAHCLQWERHIRFKKEGAIFSPRVVQFPDKL